MTNCPCGVQPEHIAELIGDTNDVRTKGLGYISKLSDEAVLNILGFLDAKSLAILQTVSKALYCFCNHEELWKALVLQEYAGNWNFQGTWQDTYIACKLLEQQKDSGPTATAASTATRKPRRYHPVSHFYSDLLHQSWLCATLEVDPTWLEVENIDRRSDLSVEDFKIQYERPNKPVILTDIVTKWPAMKKWSRSYLKKAFKNGSVIVGDAPMSFEAYCRYADTQQDELPLYLFDKEFVKTAPQLSRDYSIPEHFSEDLFSVLGEEARPDYRWLIAGPQKSGSTWHQDPNQTCAWNAVVAGSKRWIMYPPTTPPPGVRRSADGADVACPVSVMEWYLSFYQFKDAAGVTPLECTVRAGEVLFVPRGWWHAVLNLEESVAVTQNYVSAANLDNVLNFLGSPYADALVSGVNSEEERVTLHDRFLDALKKQKPEVVKTLEAEREEKTKKLEADSRLASYFKTEPKAITATTAAVAGGGPNSTTIDAEQEASKDCDGVILDAVENGTNGSGNGFSFQFNFGANL